MLSLTPTIHNATLSSRENLTTRARKTALFLFTLALFLASGLPGARGQSALDGFDPNANGSVHVVVIQPDGKILLGGEFTQLAPNGSAPVVRNHIARLNPDGTLDTSFNPDADYGVEAIALQADGKILVGGDFAHIGGQWRQGFARLDPVSGLADYFDPPAHTNFTAEGVNAILVQPDGMIVVAGSFDIIGGQDRNFVARLDPATGLADSFNPNPQNSVSSLALQADGKILAAGYFTSIGGQARKYIARLDPATGAADSFNANATGVVYQIAVQTDGKILACGSFSGANSIGGQSRNRIARLDPTTGLADSFDPNANNEVLTIAVQADGKIFAGGWFNLIGGQARHGFVRLDSTTGAPDSFDPQLSTAAYAIAVQADGKIVVGGAFSSADGQPRNRIARLENDCRLDRTTKVSVDGTFIVDTAVQPDGKILLGGSFTSILGVPRANLARLNPDSTLDTAFDPNANSPVYSIAVQADGKILVGGQFSNVGGQARHRIARLDGATGLADSFDPNANGEIDAIAVQTDGKIVVGGSFNSIGGQPRRGIARLDAGTGLADLFDPNADDDVASIAVQRDGKILVGGFFSNIGGETRNRIARLDPTTGMADSFDPNAEDAVLAMAVQDDGKILAGGFFSNIGGETRNRIARLDATTGMADSFDPNAQNGSVISLELQADGRILTGGLFNTIGGQPRNNIARLDPTTGLADSFDPNAAGDVYSITLQTDGKILVGGAFTSIGGEPRSLFGRLTNDTAALQNLVVTPATITWTRGGASPQLSRVTFESWTDNVNYTFLGPGAATGRNWSLTGLNLPAGQNIYIRARGHYRAGYQDGSENITSSVRYGPPTAPTPTPSPTPAPTPTPGPTPPGTPSPTPTPSATAAPPPPCASVRFNENFDGVTPPALPAGWATSFTPGPASCTLGGTCAAGTNWVTDSLDSSTGPNSAFHDAPGCVTDSKLDTPTFFGTWPYVTFNFSHRYNLESGFDGAVLEISVNGGPFTDIIAAGGSLYPGYNGTISSAFMSPIAGRAAWTGNSGGFIPTSVQMPNSAVGQNVVLRFRLATDCSQGGAGWRIDALRYIDIESCGTPTPTPTPIPTTTPTPQPPPTPIPTPCGVAFAQNFDGVTAPGLPAGWTTVAAGTGYRWMTSTASSASSPNNAFAPVTSAIGNTELMTPAIAVPAVGGRLSFFNLFNLQAASPPSSVGYDGMVLEISIAGGPYADIIGAGGSFVKGGYTHLISNAYGNPISGRMAWSGLSARTTNAPTYIMTIVDLPQAASGQDIVLKWRMATDVQSNYGVSDASVRIDNIVLTPACPSPTPSPTASVSPTASASPIPSPAAQALNLSTRMLVQTGDNVGIGGFIITGGAPKHVLLRAIGPSLAGFGIANPLADPILELHGPDGFTTVTNNNWKDNQEFSIVAAGLLPSDDLESAIEATLVPGSYTGIVRGANDTTGVALFEVYDLAQGGNSKLANLSTRAFVSAGNDIVIAGFILGGNSANDRIAVRGIGPSLAAAGVPDALANPTLELRDSNGALLVANNDWQDDAAQAAELIAAGLAPTNHLESAIAATLPPGPYTALLAGFNNGGGVGLVEVYDRGAP